VNTDADTTASIQALDQVKRKLLGGVELIYLVFSAGPGRLDNRRFRKAYSVQHIRLPQLSILTHCWVTYYLVSYRLYSN
jgi:hypothetical protein